MQCDQYENIIFIIISANSFSVKVDMNIEAHYTSSDENMYHPYNDQISLNPGLRIEKGVSTHAVEVMKEDPDNLLYNPFEYRTDS